MKYFSKIIFSIVLISIIVLGIYLLNNKENNSKNLANNETNNLSNSNFINLEKNFEYTSNEKDIVKNVIRVSDLDNLNISDIRANCIFIIDNSEISNFNLENLKTILTNEAIVLFKYDDLEKDIQFCNEQGLISRQNQEFNLSKNNFEIYKDDAYIRLELSVENTILFGLDYFKAKTDENLLKYVNISIGGINI